MQQQFTELQKLHPVFSYQNFSYKMVGSDLEVSFSFSDGEHKFVPKTIFHDVGIERIAKLGKVKLDLYVFNLGLAEMLSYWKATCSPLIQVEVGNLNSKQVEFWSKLIQKGMGEFFYVNDITPFAPRFAFTKTEVKAASFSTSVGLNSSVDSVLVPMGGGKDSVVSLELLKAAKKTVTIFMIGNDQASEDIIAIFEKKYGKTARINVERNLDLSILDLNGKGYLNGHTPFSSIVAFTSLLAAALFEIPLIALSNERSANESTGIYQGMNINHQYSKSFEFESDFRSYVEVMLFEAPDYFSLLRPLYEIQIMQYFSKFSEYFSVFRSCNVGKKQNRWCGRCAKCLFVSILLSAFLPKKTVEGIIGNNMLDNPMLKNQLKQLTGELPMKAFECVGTREETNLALFLASKKLKDLPVLLQSYESEFIKNESDLTTQVEKILTDFDSHNFIPDSFLGVTKHAIS